MLWAIKRGTRLEPCAKYKCMLIRILNPNERIYHTEIIFSMQRSSVGNVFMSILFKNNNPMKTMHCMTIGLILSVFTFSIQAQIDIGATTKEKGRIFYKEYHTKIKIVHAVEDYNKLKVISKSGDLLLLPGNDDKITVEADVVITSMSERWQKHFINKFMNLGFEDGNDKLVFRGDFSEQKAYGFHRISYLVRHIGTPGLKINVKMFVPHHLYVSIIDGSGDLKVKNLSNGIKIVDGAGNIHIESISGRIVVNDDSGNIKIKNIMSNGELTVRDESGDIHAENVHGSFNIHDGSGSIYLEDVEGLVDIIDGSGDIRAKVRDGRVNVKSDGSGSKHITYYTAN